MSIKNVARYQYPVAVHVKSCFVNQVDVNVNIIVLPVDYLTRSEATRSKCIDGDR